MAESEHAQTHTAEEGVVEEEFYEAVETCEEQDCVNADTDDIPPPKVSVLCVRPDVVSLAVEPHSSPQTFELVIDYYADEQRGSVVQTDSPSVDITGLCPGTEYMFTVTRRIQSPKTCVRVVTATLPPPLLSVSDIRTDCVTLSWEPPAGKLQNYSVTCCSGEEVIQELQTEETNVTICALMPGQQYLFSVCTQLQNGHKSEPAVTSAETKPDPPAQCTVSDIRTDCVTLSWEPPVGEVQNYTVTCCSEEQVVQELQTKEISVTIDALMPGQQYLFSVCAQLQNGHKSEPAVISVETKTHVGSILEDLGLEKHYSEKLCLNKMLQIDEKTMTENNVMSNKDVAWYFLKKLMTEPIPHPTAGQFSGGFNGHLCTERLCVKIADDSPRRPR